jgi:hypothetical protein
VFLLDSGSYGVAGTRDLGTLGDEFSVYAGDFADGKLWIAQGQSGRVIGVDLESLAVGEEYAVPGAQVPMVVTSDSVFAMSYVPSDTGVDARLMIVSRRDGSSRVVPSPGLPTGMAKVDEHTVVMLVALGTLSGESQGKLVVIRDDGTVVRQTDLPSGPGIDSTGGVAVAGDTAWVAVNSGGPASDTGALLRVDLPSGVVTSVAAFGDFSPGDVVIDANFVYVAGSEHSRIQNRSSDFTGFGHIVVVNPVSAQIVAERSFDGGPGKPVALGTTLWIPVAGDHKGSNSQATGTVFVLSLAP